MVATRAIDARPTQKTVRDKVYSKDQAARGEKQYTSLCANCHDPAKPPPPGKKAGPPLVGEKFLTKWDGRTLGELLTDIQTTMPNDGSAVLDDNQTADVVAYILQANGFPEGPEALKNGASSQDIVIIK
jgi:mono/diheme cytochrome c family protein